MSSLSARLLDHLVLPVGNLQAARSRYEDLGFTVAPNGRHPFGTENANVYFPDGTFLESLAQADEQAYSTATMDNTFVRNDQSARSEYGADCFSHIVLSTDNAEADDQHFSAGGISGGSKVRFSRAFVAPDGEQQEAEFLLAFASLGAAPDGCFFTCETIKAPKTGRTTLLTHANGSVRLSEIICYMQQPSDSMAFIQEVSGIVHSSQMPDAISYRLPNTTISVMTGGAIQRSFGIADQGSVQGLRHCGFVVQVENLAECRRIFDRKNIGFTMIDGRLVVHPAPGQGVFIVFEDKS